MSDNTLIIAGLALLALYFVTAGPAPKPAANAAPVGTAAQDDGFGITYDPDSGWGISLNF